MQTKFKDEGGRYRTVSLFVDWLTEHAHAIYTVGDEDKVVRGVTYISLKKKYLEIADPTEYTFAKKYFMNWKHWQKVCNNKDIQKHIDEWREELEIKLLSRSVLNIIDTSNGETKDAMAAAKWVSSKGWDKRKAGAPSKAEKARQVKIATGVKSEVDRDAERIRLVTSN